MSNKFDRLSKTFLIIAVALLLWRVGIIKPYTILPFEFFIILAGITSGASIILSKKLDALRNLRPWMIPLIALIVFLILGSVNGYRAYGMSAEVLRLTLTNFFYLGIAMLSFLLILYHGHDQKWRKKLLWAFFLPLVYFPLLYFPPQLYPKVAAALSFIPGQKAFYGFITGQGDIALLLIFPLVITAIFLIKAQSLKEKIVFWMLLVGIVSTLMWTGSRTGWASAVVAISVTFLYQYFLKAQQEGITIFSVKNFAAIAATYLAIGIFTAGTSFMILPSYAKVLMLDRIFTKDPYSSLTAATVITKNMTTEKFIKKIIADSMTPSFVRHQERGTLFKQGISLFLKHPIFGIGMAYSPTSGAIKEDIGFSRPDSSIETFKNKREGLVHNAPIQLGISGGIGSLVAGAIFAWRIFKRTKEAREKNYSWLMVAAITVGFIPGIIFGEGLFYAPFWIAAALAVAQSQSSDLQPTTNNQQLATTVLP